MATKDTSRGQLTEELASLRKHVALLQTLVSPLQSEPKTPADIPEPPVPMNVSVVNRPLAANLPEFLEDGPFGLALLDSDTRFIKANKALCGMLSYPEEELVGLPFSSISQDGDSKGCNCLIEQVMSGTAACAQIEKRLSRKDREALWVELTVSAVRDEHGKPTHALALVRDITERKRSKESLQQAILQLQAWAQELERRARNMDLLCEMWGRLRACETPEGIYAVVKDVAQAIFTARAGALYIVNDAPRMAEVAASWGDLSLVEQSFVPDECWSLRRGRRHYVEDTRTGTLCDHLQQPIPNGYLCAPLMLQNEALGVLHLVFGEKKPLSAADQRSALAMADHIALALFNLKSKDARRGPSARDPLTGLLDRSVLEETLQAEIRRATRNQWLLGLIVLEVDRFNLFRGTFGRDAAEAVFLDLSALLQTAIRKEDRACRFGEQQFCLILPRGNHAITQQRAEDLRTTIRSLHPTYRNQPVGRISISAGMAVFPEHGRTVEDLIRGAERALAGARDRGGDCVIMAP